MSLTHARHRTYTPTEGAEAPPTGVLHASNTTLDRFVCVLVAEFWCVRCRCHSQDTNRIAPGSLTITL